MSLIYKHTNRINNKIYIGQTKHEEDPNNRWHHGRGYSDNAEFYNDIQIYGWDNFSHEILARNLSISEANELEKHYILLYQSYLPENGYNKNMGGGCSDTIYTRNKKPVSFYNDTKGILRVKKDCVKDILRYQEKYEKLYS